MSNRKVKSKTIGMEIGANLINGKWKGYVHLDDGVTYFDNEEGRRMADLHWKEAKEFAAELNAQ